MALDSRSNPFDQWSPMALNDSSLGKHEVRVVLVENAWSAQTRTNEVRAESSVNVNTHAGELLSVLKGRERVQYLPKLKTTLFQANNL